MVFNEQTYCALIILLELMAAYKKRGCLLEDIAEKHQISLSEMEPVMSKLENASIIATSGKERDWLLLAEDPAKIRILHIIELFVNRFPGVFIDPDSGKAAPKNKTLIFIDEHRRVVEDYVRSRWFKVTLEKLYHMKKNRFLI